MSLTDAGKFFKAEVDVILARLEETKDLVRQIHNSDSGELKIGYISSVYQSRLADVLKEMRDIFPHFRTNLFEIPTVAQIQGLEQGTLDVGILRGPIESHRLSVNTLFFDPFMVAMPAGENEYKSRKKLVAYLKNQPFIFFSKAIAPHYHEKLMEICGRLGFVPDIVHEANNVHSILQLVEAGLGISILPHSLKQKYGYLNVSFIKLDDIPINTEVVLAYKQSNKKAALKWFIENYRP